jgi:acetyltransferase-like isoleucine patch superfamily enzyme
VTGGRVQVMRGCNVTLGWDALMTVGAGTFLNDGTHIVCHDEVCIGEDCAISWGVRIIDTDVHQLVRAGTEGDKTRLVAIGNHCWIGAGSTVLKGATLGDGCVVAANSLVTGQHAGGQLLVGAPVRAADKDVDWRH